MDPTSDMDLSSAFELLTPSLRVFQRAVGCLSKLGHHVAIIFRSDELVLHGQDDAHSAAMQFAFRRRCFRSTPAMRNAVSVSLAPDQAKASAVVFAKALLGALRGAQQRMAESLAVGLTGGEQPKLVLQFTAKFGALVRHRVPLLDTNAFLPGEPSSGPHTAALSPELLSKVLNHCTHSGKGACEEVTLVAEPKEGIRVRSYDLLEGGIGGNRIDTHETRSEVLILRSDLEACHLDARGGDVTLSGRGLRDFAKTTESYIRDLDSLGLLDGSPLLELRFGCDGGVVLCRLATAMEGVVRTPQDFSAVLLVATRELSANANAQEVAGLSTQPHAETQQSAATQGSARRAQPKQGSKRRAVALPPASAFDAFPDHSVSASQAPTISPSPAHPNMVRPTVPNTPQRPLSQPAMPAFAVQHINCPPTALSPSPSVQQQAHFNDSVPLLHPGNPTSLLQSETLALPSQSSSATQPGVPSFHQPQAVAPVPRPVVQEVPRPLVREQSTIPSSSPPPTQPAIEPRQFLFQGGRASSSAMGPPTTKPPYVPSAGSSTVLASNLAAKALDVGDDSDDEEVGADPDEVAFARGDVGGDDSVDWFDVEKLW